MTKEEGWERDRQEALRRIEWEAVRKTGTLDLGALDITEDIFYDDRLTHLTRIISRLGTLEIFQGRRSRIISLHWLEHYPNLTSLDCSGAQIASLDALRHCPKLTKLSCWHTKITSLDALQHCPNLTTLDCSRTKITSLDGLRHCPNLTTLDCWSTNISNLDGLQHCPNLTTLSCWNTQIASLDGLQHCPNLIELNCWHTKIASLDGLQHCQDLTELSCWNTQITSLDGLQHCPNLIELNCSRTKITSLDGLQHCPNLIELNCSNNPITSLDELRHTSNLTTLDCSNTEITSLDGLQHTPNLTTLNCSDTQLTSLDGLQHCQDLTELDCSRTPINSLDGLRHCQDLTELYCTHTTIRTSTEWLWRRETLESVDCEEAWIADLPQEILTTDWKDDCLPRIRDYLNAKDAGVAAQRTVKLFLLGNGRVGKTQLGRMLRGEAYDPSRPSTHGVDIHRVTLPGDPPLTVNLWDFGGQPLYHGAHALFLRDRALFLLAWSPAHEHGTHQDDYGGTHENHPLAYWVDYARAVGGQNSAALVVETQCDHGRRPAPRPEAAERLKTFLYDRAFDISAQDGLGRNTLLGALRDAATLVLESADVADIPLSWARVIDALAELRKSFDTPQPRRLLSRDDFIALCRDAGLTEGQDTLLHYLDACGELFHRPGLFHDQIILDQNWVMNAVYALFERKACLAQLRAQGGRFTAADLAAWLWDERGHSRDEQELFLSFMQSCRLCFIEYRTKDFVAHYVAPGALPPLADAMIPQRHAWQDLAPSCTTRFALPLMHRGVTERLLVEIGHSRRLAAYYGADGVQFWDDEQHCRARLRFEFGAEQDGVIRVEAQPDGPAAQDWVQALAEKTAAVIRACGLRDDGAAEPLRSAPDSPAARALAEERPAPVLTPEEAARAEVFACIKITLTTTKKCDQAATVAGVPADQIPSGALTAEDYYTALMLWAHREQRFLDLLRGVHFAAQSSETSVPPSAC